MGSTPVLPAITDPDLDKKALVIQFLRNECTAAEAAQAMQYLAEHPHWLNELAPKAEWDEEHLTELSPAVEQELRQQVMAATRKGKRITLWKPLAVAAAVLAIVISAVLLLQPAYKEKAVFVIHRPAQEKLFDTVVNTGNSMQQLALADGSRIQLQAHASVIYSTGFINKREIYLEGKAIFQVAKNPAVPFTVHSGAITTTALGTVFQVDARAAATAINVQLYEGKVVVRSVSEQLPVSDTYLQPGQQCDVNMALALVKVSHIPQAPAYNSKREVLARKVQDNKPASPALAFEKVPLKETFNRLQHIFNTTIVFEANDTAQNLFTGQFEPTDSLLQILQVIAVMNNLQVVQQNNSYRLTPKATIASLLPAPMHKQPQPITTPLVVTAPATPAAPAREQQVIELPNGKDYRKVSLATVFDQIAISNSITIQYQHDQIKELYFTGTIPNDQSAIDMLPVLCRMNGLKLTKKKGAVYIITPEQP